MPLRRVVAASPRVMSSILASFKTWRWFLDLECGHQVDRRIKYLPDTGPFRRRGFAALWHPPEASRIPPPPRSARCDQCPASDA